jgi:hypothetical protein
MAVLPALGFGHDCELNKQPSHSKAIQYAAQADFKNVIFKARFFSL